MDGRQPAGDPAGGRAPVVRRIANVLLIVTFLAFASWAASAQVTGADLWWTMAAGRYIVQHGGVPHHDVFSYTYEGAPWANQEWGSQVLLFSLYRIGGGAAVASFKIAAVIAMLVLAAWVGWKRSGSLVLAVVASVIASLVARPYLDIRAQLFLFLGSLSLLAIIEAYRGGARTWILGLLPVLMLFWVNLHFSFIYGIGLGGLVSVAELAKARFGLPDRPMPVGRALALGAAMAVAILACVVNPDHVHALTFPFGILGEDRLWREKITEWLAPALFAEEGFNPLDLGYLLIVQTLAAVAAFACAPRRFDIADFLVVAVTAAMAVTALRFIPLFALVAAPFLAKNLAAICRRLVPGAEDLLRIRTRVAALCVAIACVAASALLAVRFVPWARQMSEAGVFETLTYADYFPVRAVEFLQRNPLPGRMFHIYTWAGYIMYWLPDRKVFIDGRAHTVYPFRFYDEYESAEYGYQGWEEFLDHYGVSLILWPTGFAGGRHAVTRDLIQESPHWVCVYDDGHSAVFAHVERGRDWVEHFADFSLDYPETPEAQTFLANVYIDFDQFDRAREQIRKVLARFPQTAANWREVEARLQVAARANDAGAWFGVGFYRDIHGDSPAAAAAFRRALESGLDGPPADYARRTLARLEREGAPPPS